MVLLLFIFLVKLYLAYFLCWLQIIFDSLAKENILSFATSASGLERKLYDLCGEFLIIYFLTLDIYEFTSNSGFSDYFLLRAELILLLRWKFFNIYTESKLFIFYLWQFYLFNDFRLKSGVCKHYVYCLFDFLPTILTLVFVLRSLWSVYVLLRFLNNYNDILSILSFAFPKNDKGFELTYLI